jgi:delta24(24(1))-sterol reductase
MIGGDLVSVLVYVSAFVTGNTMRMTGNHIYDFFMGSFLNPAIGPLDLKMYFFLLTHLPFDLFPSPQYDDDNDMFNRFAEIRVAWVQLFFLTLSAAMKHKQLYGEIGWPLWVMIVAHFLYCNACMKGEECIPTTWDMYVTSIISCTAHIFAYQ